MNLLGFLSAFKFRALNAQILLFARLGYNFNSHFVTKVEVSDLLTAKRRKISFLTPFVETRKRHAVARLPVGHWRLNRKAAFAACGELTHIESFGLSKEDDFDFFFPLDMLPDYQALKGLGEPKTVFDGTLTASGRSVWIYTDHRGPLCLKFDTSQLSDPKYFSERYLTESAILHAKNVSEQLAREGNIFTEDEGYSFVFGSRHYSALIRKLDPKKINLQSSDFLIPMVAILSEEFWKNSSLLRSLGLSGTARKAFFSDMAKAFAGLIKNSLDNTYMHFEVHQQNLSLQVRAGKCIKIIYHDLQDAVFDPVSYLADQLLSGEAASEQYQKIFELQRFAHFNSQGELLRHFGLTRDSTSIVSFYRRYLRNFGFYNELHGYLTDSGLFGREFEKLILDALAFTAVDLESDDEHLKKDLFWCIDRYFRVRQKQKLELLCRKINGDSFAISAEDLKELIERSSVVASADFPIFSGAIDYTKFSGITDLWQKRVFLATYDNKPVMLLVFQFISVYLNRPAEL